MRTATAAEDVGVVASIQVTSGPDAGAYSYESPDACIIAALDKKTPAGFAVILLSDQSRLSIDIPSTAPEQINELQAELEVADVKPKQGRKNTTSTTYAIDTRPDSALARYQREARAGKGTSGKVTAKLTQKDNTAQLEFSGETATGVKLAGKVECRKVDRELGS